MIHPVKTMPKDRLLSLSQMKENSQRFVASSSKDPDLGKFAFTGACKGRRKTQKLGDFICIRQKFGKAASFTQEDTSFGAQVQLGYGNPVKGIYPYKIEFHEQDGVFI